MQASDPQTYNPADDGWSLDDPGGFMDFMGPIWTRREGDALAFGLAVEAKHLDRGQSVAPGVIMAFADHAVGSAGIVKLGTSQVTIQLQTVLVGPAYSGEFIEGRADVVSQSGSLIFLRGQITVGSRVVATSDGIWKAVRPL